MTESPDRQSEEQHELPDGEDDLIRPLPDGGLGDAMPDWLRRPPAWRGLSAPEAVVQPVTPAILIPEAVTPQVETQIASPPRELPPEDHSEIDPKRLIDLDDLPDWLRELGARKIGDASHTNQLTGETGCDASDELAPDPQTLDIEVSQVEEAQPLDHGVDGPDEPQSIDIIDRVPDAPQSLAIDDPVQPTTPVDADGVSAPASTAEHPLWQRPLVIVVAVAIAVVVIVAILVIAQVLS